MKKIHRFVIWLCSNFTRKELTQIVENVQDVLSGKNTDIKIKSDFKEKHPHYQNYFVDPTPPLTSPPHISPELDYKELLKNYQKQYGKPLKPVNPKKSQTQVPKDSLCSHCSAPAKYLYFNDGKKRSQIRCKVCANFSTLHPRHKSKHKFFCPHCCRPLTKWKERKKSTIYKCYNNNCSAYLANKRKLNWREKLIFSFKPTQFKLRYIYRDYHFSSEDLALPAPLKKGTLFNIRKSLNTLCLVLTFHVSLGLSARKTAFVLKNVFSVPASYQTVLNYTKMAAYYAHKFNLHYKGETDQTQTGDEKFITIGGRKAYTFFFVSPKRRKISSYLLANTRGALPATVSTLEAIRTAPAQEEITLVTDGNHAYTSAIQFINISRKKSKHLSHKKVIGLQNLDDESKTFRPFRQIIERLMRTYKFHTRSNYGFKNPEGALALTVLFVTHYNFLRPHRSLNYSPPVPLEEIKGIDTIQAKWAKVLDMAFALPQAA